ncbi:ribonuclease BN [Salinisphaera sp. C84B14]|uniref:YihY/virulence factor BrkB family protein n=1 Tax=Salinisphaera sp. C84B14 TaxID=1304155 RepID=UPI00333F795B
MSDRDPAPRPDGVANARGPVQIGWRGWWQIVRRVSREFSRHDMTITAAGVSFLALFAVFSALAAFVAFYGLIADPQAMVKDMQALRGFVPADVVLSLVDQMQSVSSRSLTKLVTAGAFSLVVAVWCAQQGVAALLLALDTAYHEDSDRGTWWRLFKSLFVAIGVIVGLMCTAILAIGLPVTASRLGWSLWQVEAVRAAGMAVGGLILLFGLAALYRWAPDRRPPRWRWVGAGASVVVAFWTVGSLAFSWFMAYSNSYTALYGSLSAVVMLLTLIYVTVVTVLVGAEFNAQMEYQVEEDTTVHAPRPAGQRGAHMADHSARSR